MATAPDHSLKAAFRRSGPCCQCKPTVPPSPRSGGRSRTISSRDVASAQALFVANDRHVRPCADACGQAKGSRAGAAEGCRVGIRWLKNSAISAMTASTDNDARSPAMRAFEFSMTIASAVLRGRVHLVECGLQILVGHERDTSGQFHLRLRGEILGDGGVVLDAVEERGGQHRDEHRTGQRGSDRCAKVGPVFCTPPTSPLCSSGTDETVTLPSWEASAPTPRRPVATARSRSPARRPRPARPPGSRCRRTARGTRFAQCGAGRRSGRPWEPPRQPAAM